MSLRPYFSTAAFLIGMLAIVPSGCAQDADSLRSRADVHLNAGEYEDARRHYERLFSVHDAGASALDYAQTFSLVGEQQAGLDAVGKLLQRQPESTYLLQAKGRLLRSQGRLEEAARAFASAVEHRSGTWAAGVDFAGVLEDFGRERQAFDIYVAVYREYERGTLTTPSELLAGARAATRLGRYRDANSAYRRARDIDPSRVESLYEWAELFRNRYNDAEARRTYEEALARNPRHAPSLVGLARTVPNFERREELAQAALEVDSGNTDALAVLATLRILDGLFEESSALAERALESNPVHLESLGHLASVSLLRGDSAAYRKLEQRAVAARARAGSFYETVGENATHRFRYDLAAEILERGLSTDPQNPVLLAEYGLSLMRIGRRAEARNYLENAFERDPYNLFASNTLTLLDEYEQFARLESAHFELFIHPEERDVLGPLILEVAEASFDSLSRRYPYEPPGRITIEAYNDGNDFAVRVAGVPHRGLLGVSFGDVLAVNTPAAQDDGQYNWARTLWHEIAHTMAIGVSGHRVPRWFTEGLSVYEEARARPEWAREMEPAFLAAFDANRLLPLSEIDRGFTRPQFPGQVILTYYHSGQIVAHLVERFGFDAVVEILEAFRGGADSERALREATGVRLAELDRSFRDGVDRRRQALTDVVAAAAEMFENEDAEIESVAGASGAFFQALRRGAQFLEQKNYDEAVSAFERALDLYPAYVGPGNAYEGLASVYRQTGNAGARARVLEKYVRIQEHASGALIELADLYDAEGQMDRALTALKRSLYVAPYDPNVHRRLADGYESAGNFSAAVRHRRAELALEPSDRAGAYFRLAQSLYHDGAAADAKRAVLQSLEIAPDFREAQQLLLDMVP